MIQLLYVSNAVGSLTDEDLVGILIKSRANNSRKAISGMLVHHDGVFLQILEGKETEVLKLYERIAADARHRDCSLLLRSYIDRRTFGQWSMGFASTRDYSPENLPGYNDFFGDAFHPDAFVENPSTALKILNAFRAEECRRRMPANVLSI